MAIKKFPFAGPVVKHRLGGTPTYRSWYTMLRRCLDPKDIGWNRYGGRGIKVCDRWLSIEEFVADMGIRPDGKTLDRIDVNGHYEPGNCRWATEFEQNRAKTNNALNMQKAEEIRAEFAKGFRQSAIAKKFKVDASLVSRVVRNEIWNPANV